MAIGSDLNSAQWRRLLSLAEEGYIITNELMETRIPVIFAAGHVRRNLTTQMTTARDGGTAAISSESFMSFLAK